MKKKIIPIAFIALLLVSMLCGCDPAGMTTNTDYVGTWLGGSGSEWIQVVFTDSTWELIFSLDSELSEINSGYKGSLTVYEDVMFMTYLDTWNTSEDTNSDNQISDNEWIEYPHFGTSSFTIVDDEITIYNILGSGGAFTFDRQ